MTVQRALIAAVAVTVAAAACAIAGLDWEPLRLALAIPALFLAPGFALLAAAGLLGAMRTSERVVYTLAASASVDALVGVALGLLPVELTVTSAAVALVLVTAIAAAVGLRRGRGAAAPDGRPAGLRRVRVVQVALFALALVATGAAFAVAIEGARDQEEKSHFAELWLVPPEPGEGWIDVGVRNNSTRAADYTLRVYSDGSLFDEREIALGPDQAFERSMSTVDLQPERYVRALLLDSSGKVVRHADVARSTLDRLASAP